MRPAIPHLNCRITSSARPCPHRRANLSRSRNLSGGGSHACPEPLVVARDELRRRAADSRAWERCPEPVPSLSRGEVEGPALLKIVIY